MGVTRKRNEPKSSHARVLHDIASGDAFGGPRRPLTGGTYKTRGGEKSDLTPIDTSGVSHQLNIAASVIC
jgi:hypothetical protein